MNTGAAVRRIREEKGMTQAELAGSINITQSMLCQIERGTKTLSLPLSVEIASVLGCTLDDIVGRAAG